jgi:hypothetical protein
VLALGLAHVILKRSCARQRRTRARLDRRLVGGLATTRRTRSRRSRASRSKRVERLARELVEFRPSMAIIGGPPLAHTNGLFTALAVNALNALLGADATPGGMFFTPDSRRRQPLAPSPAESVGEGAAARRSERRVCVAQGLAGPRDAREDSLSSPASAASSTTPAATPT